MKDYVTKNDVQEIVDKSVNGAIEKMTKVIETSATRVINAVSDDLGEVANDLMQHIDERFNKVETRLTSVETSLTTVEVRLTKIERKFDRSEKRFDDKDADDTVRDARIARMERWRSNGPKPKLA